jgi:murein DD-endopeptidase MepM/ murein hydrolase activator NlpD
LRRSSIIQAYEEESAREHATRRSYRSEGYTGRRYRRQRVARRVRRVRYVRQAGGELKPMPIQEVIYRDEMVPVDEVGGTLSEGLSTEEDHSAHAHNDDGWCVPVRGRLSSRYGMRYHPILRRRKLHTGDDLSARQGTPFTAARSGRVLYSGWKKGYGNTVIIDHGNGVSTLYGHASKLSAKAGQPVKAGEYIGNVGSTGWSTGPHLHFEVRKNGKPINPTPYLKGKR